METNTQEPELFSSISKIGFSSVKIWSNNKIGNFEFNKDENYMQFIEYTQEDVLCLKFSQQERTIENSPIIVTGFTAYLIMNSRKSTIEIYSTYYKSLQSKFTSNESVKPKSRTRNLEKEFYDKHLFEEKLMFENSKKVFEFLSSDYRKLIEDYVEDYFDYIKEMFCTIPKKKGFKPFPTWANKDELEYIFNGFQVAGLFIESDKPNFLKAFGQSQYSTTFTKIQLIGKGNATNLMCLLLLLRPKNDKTKHLSTEQFSIAKELFSIIPLQKVNIKYRQIWHDTFNILVSKAEFPQFHDQAIDKFSKRINEIITK